MNQKLLTTPLLQDGDRMDAAEFIRRWEAMPDLKRCELIEGVVHMPSPVSYDHGRPIFVVGKWLGYYEDSTPGCEGVTDITWLVSEDDCPQPDQMLRILPLWGGLSRDEGRYIAGPLELGVEVIVSSHAAFARKLPRYALAGMRECVAVYPEEGRVEWYGLNAAGVLELWPQPADGVFRSVVFPGLWLDIAALLRQDAAALAAAVRLGTRTPEHAAFVAQLAARRAATGGQP